MCSDLNATQRLATNIAQHLSAPLVLYLNGDLGAGKTTLSRLMIQSLGYSGNVKSPTYSFVELYPFSRLYLYHFDFYRFHSPFEFEEAGLIEYFNEKSVCLVEWYQKAKGFVPQADLSCNLSVADCDENARYVELLAHSAKGKECLSKILSTRADCF